MDKTFIRLLIIWTFVLLPISLAFSMLKIPIIPVKESTEIKYFIENITEGLSQPKIYRVTLDKYILLYYSSSDKRLNVDEIMEISRAYNMSLIVYNFEKPWVGIELTTNTTLPLVLPLPMPSILCINNDSVSILAGEQVYSKENILLLMERCK